MMTRISYQRPSSFSSDTEILLQVTELYYNDKLPPPKHGYDFVI